MPPGCENYMYIDDDRHSAYGAGTNCDKDSSSPITGDSDQWYRFEGTSG